MALIGPEAGNQKCVQKGRHHHPLALTTRSLGANPPRSPVSKLLVLSPPVWFPAATLVLTLVTALLLFLTRLSDSSSTLPFMLQRVPFPKQGSYHVTNCSATPHCLPADVQSECMSGHDWPPLLPFSRHPASNPLEHAACSEPTGPSHRLFPLLAVPSSYPVMPPACPPSCLSFARDLRTS